MAARKSGINLLPKTEFEQSFWGRFLKWGLTAGRYIIILTEMVVIMAFLSRFKLDHDQLELNDSIAGKKNILEATSTIEADFRSTQGRINQAKSIIDLQPPSTSIMNAVFTKVPSGISIENITLAHSTQVVTVLATAASEQTLAQFIATLAADPLWKSVEVGDVAANLAQQIEFNLLLTF